MLNQGSGVAILLLLTKKHGIDVTGEYGIALSTIGLISTLAASALGLSLTRSVARCYKTDPVEAGQFVGLLYTWGIGAACLFTVLLVLLSDQLAAICFKAPALSSTLRWFAPFAIGAVWNSLQLAVLSAIQRFDRIAFANAVMAAIRISVVGCAILLGDLHKVVIATVASQILGSILVSRQISNELNALGISPTLRNSWRHSAELWKFTLPNVLSSGILGPVNWLCQMLLMQAPGGAAQVGVVAIAAQWQNMIRFLPQRTIEVALPESSQLARSSNMVLYYRHLWRLMNSVGMLAVTSGVVCAALSPLIAQLYGKGVEQYSLAMAVFFCVASISIIARVMTQDLLARDKAHIELLLTGGRAVLLACLWILIEERSAVSLAAVNLGTYGVLVFALSPRWLRIIHNSKA